MRQKWANHEKVNGKPGDTLQAERVSGKVGVIRGISLVNTDQGVFVVNSSLPHFTGAHAGYACAGKCDRACGHGAGMR